MRCYKVIVMGTAPTEFRPASAVRYAATNADARALREELMAEFKVKKKDVEVVQAEVPTAKADLLGFLNDMLKPRDLHLREVPRSES